MEQTLLLPSRFFPIHDLLYGPLPHPSVGPPPAGTKSYSETPGLSTTTPKPHLVNGLWAAIWVEAPSLLLTAHFFGTASGKGRKLRAAPHPSLRA